MIPINLIRQYKFCPRIVYYNLLTNIKPIYPRQVNLGSDYHELQEEMLKSRKFKKFHIDFEEIISDKYFENENFNICGKVDLAFIIIYTSFNLLAHFGHLWLVTIPPAEHFLPTRSPDYQQ